MALTVNGTAASANAVSVLSLTLNYDCGALSDGLVVFGFNDNTGNGTACSYKGTSMTSLFNVTLGGIGAGCCGFLLSQPASGSNPIVCTWSASAGVQLVAMGLKGLKNPTASAFRTAFTDTSADPPSITVTNSVSGDLVFDHVVSFPTPGSASAGQTLLNQNNPNGGSLVDSISYKTAVGANTVMSWANSGLSGNAHGAVALIPASGAGGGLFVSGNPLTGQGVGGKFFSNPLNARSRLIIPVGIQL